MIVNMGVNDLEKTLDPSELTATWTTNFDGLLNVVDELRAGRPTAVRMLV